MNNMILVKWKINGSKELKRANGGKRKAGVVGRATEPTFSNVQEINVAFKYDILQRKETWKHLCHICDYATNTKQSLTKHLAVHGIGDRFKCDQCDKDFSIKCELQKHITRVLRNVSNVLRCIQQRRV